MYAIFDVIVTFGIVYFSFLTFLFRSNELTTTQTIAMFSYCGGIALLTLLVFTVLRIYRIVTIYFSLYDAIKIASTVALIHIVGLIVLLVMPSDILARPSIAAWALSALSLVCLLAGARLSVRGLNAVFHLKKDKGQRVRTLVVGAGAGGKVVLDDSRRNQDNNRQVVLFLDDDPNKINGTYSSIPIKGPILNIAKFIDKYEIEEVVIAIVHYPREKFDELLHILQNIDVRISRLPELGGMIGPHDVKMTRIDIDGLLERHTNVIKNDDVNNMLLNKTVLVTGAGGSIGSELCRQIFAAKPKTLILFDIYENSTYEIQQELLWKARKENIEDINVVSIIGSTYNVTRVENVIKKYRPDYIYHAAAYKHVPLMEDSPMEAIRTNVIGTYNVAFMADKYHVKKMLLVSTDKAVRPTNVMGATKRFAELIIQYFSSNAKNTNYCAVRFGNVLGSNGSVVPLFANQIKNMGPVTVTDKDIIRYFMTIPEAVSLILNSSLLAEDGELFILDMGTPVSILKLAEHMIRQAGYRPYKDIKIIFTGLRPGEKLFEETLLDASKQEKTSNGRIYVEKKSRMIDVPEEIKNISKAFELEDNSEIKKLLAKIVITYTPDLKHHD